MLVRVSATSQTRAADDGGIDEPADRGARAAVPAVIVMFGANAALYASFVTRIPAIRDRTGATTSELGLALLLLAIGSIVAMNVAGRLISSHGSARVLTVSVILSALAFPMIGLLETPLALAVGLAIAGAGYGPWDVAMNVQAHRVETDLARPLMSRFHGCWSLGALSGAGVGAFIAEAGVPVIWHLAGAAAMVLVVCLLAVRRFIPDRPPAATGTGSKMPKALRWQLVGLGVLTLCATLVEGAAADWLPLYLTDERSAGPGLAATGYVVFALSMAIGRLTGTAILERLGRVKALRLAGALAGLGVLATITLPGIGGALVGTVGWGLGVALVFPTAMSAAADASARPGEAIAVVATIGYAGFLAGPPMIGFLGDLAGLGWGLACCLPLALGVIALAGRARPAPSPHSRD